MYNRCFQPMFYQGFPRVNAQTKFPAVNEMIPSTILSDSTQICGQTHRTSMDFQVGATQTGANIWQVNAPTGVTFEIWEDIPHGTDKSLFQGVKNGSQLKLNPSNSSSVFTYYVANPQGATAGFDVTLTPVNLEIPPPPPPPSH